VTRLLAVDQSRLYGATGGAAWWACKCADCGEWLSKFDETEEQTLRFGRGHRCGIAGTFRVDLPPHPERPGSGFVCAFDVDNVGSVRNCASHAEGVAGQARGRVRGLGPPERSDLRQVDVRARRRAILIVQGQTMEVGAMSTVQTELKQAAASVDNYVTRTVSGVVAGLSEDAYELASLASEDLYGVGLTGLVEDYYSDDAIREDIVAALRAGAEGSTTNSGRRLAQMVG
jgi:hypothetical protein